MTAAKDDSSNFDLEVAPGESSNFELAALKDDSSGNFDILPSDDVPGPATPKGPGAAVSDSSEDDFSLELDEDVGVGTGGGELNAPGSGINLRKPVDAGSSLEERKESDDSLEFDLSLEPEATPKPA